MLFNHKFPNVKPEDCADFEGSAVFKSVPSGRCMYCKQLTHWVETSFHQFCCSEECSRAMWTAYFAATAKGMPRGKKT